MTSDKLLDVGPEPTIRIRADGNLEIAGQDRTTISIDASGELEISREGDDVLIELEGRASLIVPERSHIIATEVERTLEIQGVRGPLDIGNVGAGLKLDDAGPTTVGSIGASLKAREIHGDLRVTTVGGSARVSAVHGSVEVRQIGGSLRLSDVDGGLTATCGGNALAFLSPRDGHVYDITAGGSIRCALPPGARADVRILSGADVIRVDLPAERVAKGHGSRVLTLGGGGPVLSLSAGGSVSLGPVDADGDALNQDLEQEFERKMEEFGRAMSQWGESFGSEFGPLGTQLADRVHRAVESAQRKASHKLERKLQRHMARQERFMRVTTPRPPTEPRPVATRPPRPRSEPVNDEERAIILRMLSDGKISADQADELLRALGPGREAHPHR